MNLPNGQGRDYMNWLNHEADEHRREVCRETDGRFATAPEPQVVKRRLAFDSTADCHYCGAPIFPGEWVFQCDVTFVVGCSEEHCRDMALAKLTLHS